jgi:hypothetical protein
MSLFVSIVTQANTLELVLQNASAAMQGHIQSQWALRQHPHASLETAAAFAATGGARELRRE